MKNKVMKSIVAIASVCRNFFVWMINVDDVWKVVVALLYVKIDRLIDIFW